VSGGSGGGRGGSAAGAATTLSPRQWTSQQILQWDWDTPYAAQSRSNPQTMDQAAAFEMLTRDDRRPLLVLRECDSCKGTEDAFLSREFDNEKTTLYGRWFHAVKFAPDVLDETHAYHTLFGSEDPPHLFVASADGQTIIKLSGAQSQAELWKAMNKVLKSAYKKSPDKAVKEFRKLLDKLDHLDSMLEMVEQQIVDERVANGPDSKGLKKLEKRKDDLVEERDEALEKGAKLDDLQLKPEPKTKR
jgi:hypothetical protein